MRAYRHSVSSTSVTLAVIVVIVAIDVATTQSYFDEKKADDLQHQRPFYIGTRYGRSGSPTNLIVAPRNDKFFMGSRYGKRSGSSTSYVPPATVSCRYTGIGVLYRCEPVPRNSAGDQENSLLEGSSMNFVTPSK